MSKLGDTLKEYRRKKMITQEELSKLIGISKMTVNKIENSDYEPVNILTAEKIRRFFEENENETANT